jgi:hypothetical protein
MTLHVNEFLRRFLLHVLPPGFVRIRHFGFLSTRQRSILLPLCFRLLGAAAAVPEVTARARDIHHTNVSSCCVLIVSNRCWFWNDGPLPTSFPLSIESPHNGGPSQHDPSRHTSRMPAVLLGVDSTCALCLLDSLTLCALLPARTVSCQLPPLLSPDGEASRCSCSLKTHTTEHPQQLPSSPSIRDSSAKRLGALA